MVSQVHVHGVRELCSGWIFFNPLHTDYFGWHFFLNHLHFVSFHETELDESTACWHLKSPRSLLVRSLHLTFQGHGHIWSLEFNRYVCFSFRGNQPIFCWYSKFHFWPWKFKVKVMAKVKPDGPIWGLNFNWYVCFSFRGNWTIFVWDIANSIFDLQNSRSRSWPRSNTMIPLEA